MNGAQLDLIDYDHWLAHGQWLARMLQAMQTLGHVREPEYAAGSLGWPVLRARLRFGFGQPIGAALQTSPTGAFRYLIIGLDGFVENEGDWCSTEGGARGWLGRNSKPWTGGESSEVRDA